MRAVTPPECFRTDYRRHRWPRPQRIDVPWLQQVEREVLRRTHRQGQVSSCRHLVVSRDREFGGPIVCCAAEVRLSSEKRKSLGIDVESQSMSQIGKSSERLVEAFEVPWNQLTGASQNFARVASFAVGISEKDLTEGLAIEIDGRAPLRPLRCDLLEAGMKCLDLQ
jgi:hypothetical protein